MKLIFRSLILAFSFFNLIGCNARENSKLPAIANATIDAEVLARLDTAFFASGCFWCTEAVFERIKGVENVISGYSGGTKLNPTYEEVSAGLTDYAEAVRVVYDPQVVSYQELVEMFFASHDPTQLNRQGPDVGKQYRSAIFYRNGSERETAEQVMQKLNGSGKYNKPIVTEITKFTSFYEAEDYHQNYYELHPNQPYVASVSRPKVEKFMKEYRHKLKDRYK